TKYVRTWEEYSAACDGLSYPTIVKSIRSGQGTGVFKVDTKEELEKFLSQMQDADKSPKNYILQKFFDYELDLRVLVIGDKMFSMQRIPREGDFRANFSLGGTVKKHELTQEQKELALKA